MSRDVKRSARVSGRLREELSVLLRRLGVPRVSGALITRVELTDDLSFARIFIRHELGAEGESAQQRLVAGLESASRKLRGELTRALGLRAAPQLRFVYDSGIDAQNRVEELLKEIADEG